MGVPWQNKVAGNGRFCIGGIYYPNYRHRLTPNTYLQNPLVANGGLIFAGKSKGLQ